MGETERKFLKDLRLAHPELGVRPLTERLMAAFGVRVNPDTVHVALCQLGLNRPKRVKSRRVEPVRTPERVAPTPTRKKKPYASPPAEMPPSPANRRAYPTDLSDREWAILEPLIPKAMPGGRPEEWPKREIVNAMFYVLRNGCTWRSLPHDFPPWETVYWYFAKWREIGLWQRINDALRASLRMKAGRKATPSAAIIDSQSAKTTEKGGSVATMAPSA